MMGQSAATDLARRADDVETGALQQAHGRGADFRVQDRFRAAFENNNF
jgi:hypothetical protein